MNESIITSVDGCNATTVATFANESASVTVTSDCPIGNAGNFMTTLMVTLNTIRNL